MIATETHLREILGSPSDLVVAKVADRLNGLTRRRGLDAETYDRERDARYARREGPLLSALPG